MPVDDGADAHDAVGVELARERVHNGAGQLVEVARAQCRADFLDEGDVGFVDVDDEILALVREQVLHHVIGGDVRLVRDLDQHAHAAHVGIEAELAGLEVDIAGQDVVENHVLDKVAAVVLLIVILLDAVQRDGKQAAYRAASGIVAGDEHRVFRTRTAAEGLIGVAVEHKRRRRRHDFSRNALVHLADASQLAARNDHRGFVNDADCAVNGVAHLMDDALEQSV